MAIIGAVFLTVVLWYVALALFAWAIPPLTGLDEFHIPVGIALVLAGCGVIGLWWFFVGQHIHVTFG